MMNNMIIEILAVALIITAFLAINLDNSIYSVIALGCVLIFSALLYFFNGAFFAAVFQFAVGAGTIAVLLIVSETLDEQESHEKKPKLPIATIIAAVLFSIPVLIFTVPVIQIIPEATTGFPYDLWDFRSIDVIVQGIVILIIAVGMVILLKSQKGAE
jgi:NADH:ubiquinone oxidoreductase subunit 6 (subunit J)